VVRKKAYDFAIAVIVPSVEILQMMMMDLVNGWLIKSSFIKLN
jgi:hypothetical protein